jgi:hypothetical protein
MTRDEYTELCKMYLEPLNCNNIKTVLMKCSCETAVYCGGIGVTKYDTGDITNRRGVYFPYSFKYDKRIERVRVNDAYGKATYTWDGYIRFKITEDDRIKEYIAKLSKDIIAMLKKERMNEIKNCGAEYELV